MTGRSAEIEILPPYKRTWGQRSDDQRTRTRPRPMISSSNSGSLDDRLIRNATIGPTSSGSGQGSRPRVVTGGQPPLFPPDFSTFPLFANLYILVYTPGMKDLSVTEFRRQCLSLLEDLPEEGLLITKHGQPLARITPVPVSRTGQRVTLPLLPGKGQRGPLCPDTETPYDLVFD